MKNFEIQILYYTFAAIKKLTILTDKKKMIQTVVKRDGRIVGFNESKISGAIRKAMLHTEIGEDANLINQITDHIATRVKSQMTVEDLQEAVERELMK